MSSVRKEVTLDSEDVEWFSSTYEGASLSWALGLLLHQFRAAHGDRTPADFARIGAGELKKMLEG